MENSDDDDRDNSRNENLENFDENDVLELNADPIGELDLINENELLNEEQEPEMMDRSADVGNNESDKMEADNSQPSNPASISIRDSEFDSEFESTIADPDLERDNFHISDG